MVHEVRLWCGLSVRRREIDLDYEETGYVEILGDFGSGLKEALICTILHNIKLGFDVTVFVDLKGEEKSYFEKLCKKMACCDEFKNVEYANEGDFFVFKQENRNNECVEVANFAWLERSRSGTYLGDARACHYVFRWVSIDDDVTRKDENRQSWWMSFGENKLSNSPRWRCGEVAIGGIKKNKESWSFRGFEVFLSQQEQIQDEEVSEKLEQIRIDRDRQRLSGYLNKETNLFASKRATCSVL